MELNYDWKSFQSIFYPKKRLSHQEQILTGSVYLVVRNHTVVTGFSEGEDLSSWIGSSVDKFVVDHPQREVIILDQDKVDQWTDSIMGMPHFYDQILELRRKAKLQSHTHSHLKLKNKLNSPETWNQRHFLLQAIQTWWHKIFPSTFGVYVRISDKNSIESSILLVVQRGSINTFYVPDLSPMIAERRKYNNDVVRFLSSKYMVPVQGLFVNTSEWIEWSEMNDPWSKIATTLKRDRTKLVPFQWSIVTLINARARFGF